MAWIPISNDLSRRSEVIRLSAILGIDRHSIVGCLCDFWGWASGESVDGTVDGTVDGIETALSLPPGFIAGMIAVGWLATGKKPACKITIKNWDRWLSNSAKSRLQKNLRQQKWRRSGVASVDGAASTEARPQNRTEQNNSKLKIKGKKSLKEILDERLERKRLAEISRNTE